MPATAAEVLQEFELESMTTRRVLERVPTDQLTWKPHPKSRSLGQLALHVAIGPGLISQWALQDSMEMPDMGEPPQPTSNAQILAVHDDSVQKVKTAVLARTKTRCRLGKAKMQSRNRSDEPQHGISSPRAERK